MAGGNRHLCCRSTLAWLLAIAWGTCTAAQDVMPSDNPADYPSSYRSVMNSSELSRFGVGSVGLVPLSAELWTLSAQDFSNTLFIGNLQDVNASSATDLPVYTIPYISCDEPEVVKAITDSFNSTDDLNVVVAVLYSQSHTHCNISSELTGARWLNLLTVSDRDQAREIAALDLTNLTTVNVQIRPDLAALPPGTGVTPQRRNSPIPMIVLYALTSMITMLLLFVIIGGALKARRHPERYGPRAILRPRQSRAKGIAMAMLETLPIVKFGDPDPKQAKRVEGEGDMEMSPVIRARKVEDKQSKPELPSAEIEQRTPNPTTDESRAKTQRPATDEANPSTTTTNGPDPSPSSPQDPDSTLPKHADDSLGCSICTEDFTLGEELRVLPCNHKFHPLCVDPWLLNVSGTCPLCRIDLRPPDEAEDDENEQVITLASQPRRSHNTRPRSTIGGIMRGTRGLDLQSIVEASREERIRILRRWREERQRDPAVEEGNAQRRSRRMSQWLRDGFSVRPSPEPYPEQNVMRTSTGRANSWYGGEAGSPDPAPQLPPIHADAATSTERARSWYVGAGVAQRRSLDSRGVGGESRVER